MKTTIAFDIGRVWKHYQDKSFGIMSAFKGESSKKENIENQKKLKEELRELGYGYKEMKGSWRPDEKSDVVLEYGLFIPNFKKKDAKELGKKYDQYAVIYTDEDNIILDMLGHEDNKVFNKIETDLKDSWISWSEFRRHKFRFSEVSWDFKLPPEPKNWMMAQGLQAFLNDTGISEYKREDDARVALIQKVTQKLKAT